MLNTVYCSSSISPCSTPFIAALPFPRAQHRLLLLFHFPVLNTVYCSSSISPCSTPFIAALPFPRAPHEYRIRPNHVQTSTLAGTCSAV
ncbi:hypothetical protein RRG08_053369 [Elysia crispata]|uniref:Uncharacterized protein n=1 Tax=Elysia crispata TaxID=231223 RepID=A0AAE0Z652_9GAST|nr:hypothetical protein RRG08_053369 [Elysia crispata]